MRSALLLAMALPALAQPTDTLPPVVRVPTATPSPSEAWAPRKPCPSAMPSTLAPLALPQGCPAPGDGFLLAGSVDALRAGLVEQAPTQWQWIAGGALGALALYASCDVHVGEVDGDECSTGLRWGTAGVALIGGALLAWLGD